jgi:hypothetical protein
MRSDDDTLALIRSRIEEKRLFEARFLCRKLGQSLSSGQCALLEKELNGSLAQIERWRQEAKDVLARGEHSQAGELYTRIEAIAIDVPGVAEEKKVLAGAEALAARLLKPAEDEAGSAPPANVQLKGAPSEERPATGPAPQVQSCLKPKRLVPRPWLLAGFAGIVLCGLLLLFFAWSNGPQRTPAVTPETNRIVLKPLLSTTQKRVEPETPVVPPPSPVQATKEQNPPAASAAPALKLGNLQIEQSEHP